MSFRIQRFAVVAAAVLAAGCYNRRALDVPNVNNPDVERTYSTPAGVESVISSTYRQVWGAMVSCGDCINTQAHSFSLENYSELNNNVMNIRSIVPRGPIGNERNGAGTGANYALFRDLSKATRSAANGIQALERLVKASTAVPQNGLGSKAQDARARAFGFMSAGWALGGLAMVYDSAAIVTPSTPADRTPGLSHYTAVTTAALLMLDSAIYWAGHPDATIGANGFPMPTTWINGNGFTQAQFVAFVRSQRARVRAAVARTPAERAAVNWATVIADAQAGITADFQITLSVAAGWSGNGPFDTNEAYSSAARHQAPLLIWGMADTSGAYANFIATPFGTRDGTFLIRTPDTRFPQGATRTAQQTDTPQPLPAPRYVRNRPTGEDVPGAGYGSSQYEFRRWMAVNLNTGNGVWTNMAKIELDMLVAEGHIRAGNFAAAATLIDAARARHGLPSIGTITSATQQIAGGSACVPKVPQAPAFNTVGCGTILEAMKWEKRLETAFSCAFICWYTDSRGWGDLPEGTAIQWPVPYQEMDARVQPFYGMAGPATKGTYGW
ncbi:MAG: hypothetical protein FJ202_06590 [Gemmatimonadetes bacterium]|nr:hypothetical protein [Gemmatimonadota bacterium]